MEETLIIIKPDAIKKKYIGQILSRFENAGLNIAELKIERLSKSFVDKFYAHLKQKLHPKMLEDIHNFMTSHHVVVAILEGEEAITKTRALCGPTDPAKAPKGTIRGDFADDIMAERDKRHEATQNAIHSSGNAEEAKKEISLIREFIKESSMQR